MKKITIKDENFQLIDSKKVDMFYIMELVKQSEKCLDHYYKSCSQYKKSAYDYWYKWYKNICYNLTDNWITVGHWFSVTSANTFGFTIKALIFDCKDDCYYLLVITKDTQKAYRIYDR